MAINVTKRSLKGMTDESVLRMLISVARDRFDPAVKNKPTKDEAEWIMAEMLIRMAVNSITCPECSEQVRNSNFCGNCGIVLSEKPNGS